MSNPEQNQPIENWQQFTAVVRSQGCQLLHRLDDFPDAILVTGCQRSGTTIMARILTQSEGMVNYWFGSDDELDAALILSGSVDHTPAGRYCFQTTYLDECYPEYFEHQGNFKIIWVLRNPYSVATSLMYNWSRSALTGTFHKNTVGQLEGFDKWLVSIAGPGILSRVRQASLLYSAKTRQLFDLVEKLGQERVYVLDYDDLVLKTEPVLRQLYQFLNLKYQPEYGLKIHKKSVTKKDKLSPHEFRVVKSIAEPIYQKAQILKST